jgi:hypothetical protein
MKNWKPYEGNGCGRMWGIWHLPRETEENYENPNSKQPVSGPRLDPGPSTKQEG